MVKKSFFTKNIFKKPYQKIKKKLTLKQNKNSNQIKLKISKFLKNSWLNYKEKLRN